MASRRVLKAAEAIREVVSTAILTELRDPRIQSVTVTYVEVSGDLRSAKIHVSIMGDQKQQELCLHGLKSSAGFLQQRVAQRIDTRYTPRLVFHLDRGVKNSIAISKILQDVLGEQDALSEQDLLAEQEALGGDDLSSAPGRSSSEESLDRDETA